ncbi:MAG: hypothetical protein L0I76_35920 [Pseudonocardia sp.]|nr:hypothetical protein [Pseudonocardia sp.]
MARTSRADPHDDPALLGAYRIVADELEQAVRDTLSSHEPDPARLALRKLTAVDAEFSSEEAPPGWSLAFLVLADWIDAARVALEAETDRVDRALDWIGAHLGPRYRSRARYTIPPLQTLEGAQETSHYIDALGDDFLASLVWTVAALSALYGDDDAGWARALHGGG